MRWYSRWLTIGLLILLDILVFTLLFAMAVELRNGLAYWIGFRVHWKEAISVLQVVLILLVGVFAFLGLYPGYGLTGVKELEQVSKAVLLLLLMTATVFYLNKPFQRFPRSILVFTLGLAWLVMPVGRALFRNVVSRFAWYGEPVVVFGPLSWAREVGKDIAYSRRLGWRVTRYIPLVDVHKEVKEMARKPSEIRVAVLALPRAEDPAPYARVLAQHFRQVILIQDFSYFGSLWVDARDIVGRLGLEFQYHLLRPWSSALKRLVDVTGSAFLLLLLSPLLLLLALWIKLDSPGPVLFRQKRLGKGFSEFYVLKFRTMVLDAEQRLQEILAHDPLAREQYEKFHKLENDPRITRSGRWLRKFSLDELPQLINVLLGQMSLVGPRAYMPSELGDMGSYAEVILRVRPGMTGWWQVQGRHRTTFQRRLEMDEYYISNWSFWLDVFILLKTAWVVIRGEGG